MISRSARLALSLTIAMFAVAGKTPAADVSAGEKLAYTCHGCHGIPDYKASFPEIYRVPKIAGQSEKYLASALAQYKKGDRKHPTMQAQAQSFSDQDIADLSAYLSSVK